MSKHTSRGPRLALALVIVALLGGGGWWYRTTRPAYRLRHGQAAARAGDFGRAAEYAALLEDAGAADAHHLLRGEILLLQGSPDMALPVLNRVQTDGEPRLQAALLAARCLIALKKPREAERALLYVLSQDSERADAHRWLATIYYDQGDLRRAVPHLEEAARLDPAGGRPHRLVGLIYKDMEEPDNAVAAYRESLRRDPAPADRVAILEELGEALLKQYREADALETVKGLETSTAAVIRAEALPALGRGDEVGRLLDEALRKWPSDGGLLRLRGERYRAAGEPATAAALLERVIALDPEDYRSRTQLALCYEALGRPADAKTQQDKVKEIQTLIGEVHDRSQEAMDKPWDAAVRYKLEELCRKLNRPQLAKMWHTAAEACRTAQ